MNMNEIPTIQRDVKKISTIADWWRECHKDPSLLYHEDDVAKRAGLRVALINPPHIQNKKFFARVAFEPVGLAYVASSLEKAGFEVKIVDAIGEAFDQYNVFDNERVTVGLSFDEICQSVEEFAPDFIGIGAPFTVRAEAIYKCSDVLKACPALKDIPIFSGGIHCSTYPKETLSQSSIDFVIQGEGEVTSVLLLDALRDNSPELYNLPCLAFKNDDGSVKLNARGQGIDDLDALPHPARHLLNMENYMKAAKRFRSGRGGGSRFASVTTSRGCPLQCTFCTTHDMMGRKYRYRSPQNVIDELLLLKREYNVEEIHFEDDQLTIRRGRFEEMMDLMIQHDINVKWDTPNGVLASSIASPEIIEKMKKSGCWYICVAPESGDQEVVDQIIKKKQKLTKVDFVVEHAAKLGIRVDAFFVIGSIGETKQQIMNSIEYAKKLRRLGAKWCHFHIATPFDGTPLYKLAEAHGYLVEKKGGQEFAGEMRIKTDNFTPEEIDEFYVAAHSMNPRFEPLRLKLALSAFRQEPLKVFKAFVRFLTTKNSHMSQ